MQFLLLVPAIPIVLWVGRAMLYAKLRATAVQMSPTQFPEGYRMVVEAARKFGMRRVPDAYVVMGNGRINAYSAGHGSDASWPSTPTCSRSGSGPRP